MKTKHTQGRWNYSMATNMVFSLDKNGEPNLGICQVVNQHDNKEEYNARLIAEAGTVASETGYTPRQLAYHKAELLDVLEDILAVFEERETAIPVSTQMKIEEAIKNATGVSDNGNQL